MQANTFQKLLRNILGVALLAGCQLASAEMTARQNQLLVNNCVQCHAAPHLGAPLMGSPEAAKLWQEKGEELLLRNVVLGIREMPPLGKCSACTEEDFRAMIRLMTGAPSES